nr:hypothetical protein [Tanacetum cinerariifolium]
MQTTEEKVDTSKALDASLVNTESSGKESGKQDTNSSSRNDVDADDADIKPLYDEELMDEVQLTVEINVLATGQQHTEQPEFNNEGEVDQNAPQWKPVLQPYRNQLVVRQPTAFKSERPRISKPQFASQVDVYNDLSKRVTTHYLPKERESAVVKPHHVIASSESRNSLKNMPRFSSNDMVRNHYLEEAMKKTQTREVNSCAKVSSNKTTNINKPVEQTSFAKKPERQIPKGHRWKPTGKIFKTVNLRWVPTGNIFTSTTTKVNSESTNGSNEDITNQYEYEQTLDVSAVYENERDLKLIDAIDVKPIGGDSPKSLLQ